MRVLVASGELAELAAERIWQELARGLMEAHPARLLAVLRNAAPWRSCCRKWPRSMARHAA
jgi:tRNA nucleotidyltransferase/poly(A) polymerase